MVDAREELFDVALERPRGACMIFGNLGSKTFKPFNSPVRTLAYPAGIRVVYESAVEVRVEHTVERVVQKPVAHGSLVYVARLGVGDLERVVTAVAVSFIF